MEVSTKITTNRIPQAQKPAGIDKEADFDNFM